MMRAALIFCRSCGAGAVDVLGWSDESTAIVGCSSCGHEGTLVGFTLGRADVPGAARGAAFVDAAGPRTLPVPRTLAARLLALAEQLAPLRTVFCALSPEARQGLEPELLALATEVDRMGAALVGDRRRDEDSRKLTVTLPPLRPARAAATRFANAAIVPGGVAPPRKAGG